MSALRVVDVRAEMPRREGALAPRTGAVLGVAVHHSATAHPATGLALDTAHTLFEHHVLERGWQQGGYHYVIRPTGLVEYALDEAALGRHAGFEDPDDVHGLGKGQFWNEHYLAICLLGWFDTDRVFMGQLIPNHFTRPTPPQWAALLALTADLCTRYALPVENVRGHRELAGCRTRCPGTQLDLARLRAELA
jgi:N-acetyl-anhydromuramyl-L-alanine amidase AmpD